MPPLPRLQRAVRHGPPFDAVPLPRLRQALFRAHWQRDGRHQARLPHPGRRPVPADYRHQGRLKHEAAPRPGHQPKVGLAPGAPHPRVLGARSGPVRRPGGGGRDLRRRQGTQQAREEEGPRRARARRQDPGGGGAGPRHERSGRAAAAGHRRGRSAGLRARPRRAGGTGPLRRGGGLRRHGGVPARSRQALRRRVRARGSAYERHRVVWVPVQARPVRHLSPDERPSSRPLPHGVRGTVQRPRLRHGGTDAAHGAGPGRPDADLPAADRQNRSRGPSGALRAERRSPLPTHSSRSMRFMLGARGAPDLESPGATRVRPGPSMQAVERRGSAVFGPRRARNRLARGALHRQPDSTGAGEGASLIRASSIPLAGSIQIRSHLAVPTAAAFE